VEKRNGRTRRKPSNMAMITREGTTILKCADVSKFKLPATYKPVMKAYLAIPKKEKAIAKTNCQLTEQDTDTDEILGSDCMSNSVHGQCKRDTGKDFLCRHL
jgi:hypothetical protein